LTGYKLRDGKALMSETENNCYKGLKSNFPFVCRMFYIIVLLAAHAYPLSKEYIISKMEQAEKTRTPAYEATLTTAAYVQGMVVKDSGTLIFSPPSCCRILLFVSRTETSTCGDTTWLKSPDGSITVTADKSTAGKAGIAGLQGGFSIVNLLKKSDCEIKNDGKLVSMFFTVDENNEKTEMELSIDTSRWIVTRNVMKNSQYGTLSFDYKYFLLDGKPVANEINTEMGSLGRVTYKVTGFKKIKRRPRKYFRLL